MSEALKPSVPLLVKLGSLAVHVEEFLSPNGHEFDRAAIQSILNDAEVKTWLEQIGGMGFLPVKR